ncbi:MAG: glycosyltransferase family 9 protein, partial [candidate division Zixibacteria bacterium]|nr:glycosyltransferase family 9 protein [candidate division Zixibacteria bacterium]
KALRENFPEAEIDFLTRDKYTSLAGLLPGVSRVISYQPGKSFSYHAKEINRTSYDCLIDLQVNWRSFWLRKHIHAKRMLICKKDRLLRWLIVLLPTISKKTYSVKQSYLDCIRQIGVKLNGFQPGLHVWPGLGEKAEKLLSDLKISQDATLVAMAPGAKWETKRWDMEKFISVAKQLRSHKDIRLLALGSREESVLLSEFSKDVEGCLSFPGIELPAVAALLSKCSLLIGNDSGLMHMAAALNVSTIAIFGPTHPRLGFAPNGDKAVILTSNQPCSPCSLHGRSKCFQPSRYCMDKITPEHVLDFALKFLSEGASPRVSVAN